MTLHDPESSGTPLTEIGKDPESYDWFPHRAEYVGNVKGVPHYREEAPPPPPRMPGPPPDPPPACVPITEIQAHPEDFPWYPDHAAYCGDWDRVPWYQPTGNGNGNGNGNGDGEGGREHQPPGDVEAEDSPAGYIDPALDDLLPFDPE